jgi:hypothetical protein
MPRSAPLHLLILLVLAGTDAACTSNNGTSTPGSGSSTCATLVACCATLPGATGTSCLAVAGAATGPTCASVLSGYMAAGECGGPHLVFPGPDGSIVLPDGGVVGPSDAGPSRHDATVPVGTTFSGPSCPPGSPPNTFVPADAGVNCTSCANNCAATSDFQDECASYYGCFCACAATDTGCQQACTPLEGDCMSQESALESCISTDCASLCATPATGACAMLYQCCEKLTDGGPSPLGESCTQLSHPDGGEAECQSVLTQLASLCKM